MKRKNNIGVRAFFGGMLLSITMFLGLSSIQSISCDMYGECMGMEKFLIFLNNSISINVFTEFFFALGISLMFIFSVILIVSSLKDNIDNKKYNTKKK